MQMDDGHLVRLDREEIQHLKADNPDLIFHVGEKVQVKGGDFRVKSMGRKMMVLEGLPGTRIRR